MQMRAPQLFRISLQRVALCAVLFAAVGALAGCGGGGGEEFLDASAVTQRAPSLNNGPWSAILRSPAYTGKLAVMFADGTGVRLKDGELTSITGMNLGTVGGILKRVRDVSINRGIPTVTDDEIQAARAVAAKQGRTLHDWSLLYIIAAPDPTEAEQLLHELGQSPLVRYAHPLVRAVPLGSVTPSLETEQTYLLSGNGGLNVTAAWAAGLTGKGTQVVDIEVAWNFEHEDLPIGYPADLFYKPGIPEDQSTPEYLQHGTAAAGLIAAFDNDIGIKGIAPDAGLKVAQTNTSFGLPYSQFIAQIVGYNLGKPSGIRPGAIVVEEVGAHGPADALEFCHMGGIDSETQGCLPVEAYQYTFEVIEEAVKHGVVVIEGAGNGGIDLATTTASTGGPNLADGGDDSGAIMVGASTGADMVKLPESNCGSRVNVFAWGKGVVTTGYGDLADGGDSNSWYTASFRGTSAATAQIAGIAALMQEYVKVLHGPAAYLNSYQMRDLLVKAGEGHEALGVEGCPIGVQPDVGKAMELLAAGAVEHVIAQPSLAAPFDLDGDGRADLVSFSKDRKWYVDLSGLPKGAEGDRFGAWDLVLEPLLPAGGSSQPAMYFPVVGDYNTDGKADLALYESVAGKWYVRHTDDALLSGQWGDGWNCVVDYSIDPNWQPYGRPVPGDYNGADDAPLTFDRWLDPAIVTPDGDLLIDYVTQEEGEAIGEGTREFDTDISFLTDDQLVAAPGWAYYIAYGIPPPLVVAENFKAPEIVKAYVPSSYWIDHSSVVTGGGVYIQLADGLMLKQVNGKWPWQWDPNLGWAPSAKESDGWLIDDKDFGGIDCRPIPADYDGDGALDRAVQCPNEWRILYSNAAYPVASDGLRHVTQSGAAPVSPLPGYVYPGGYSYQEVNELYAKYNYGCKGGDAGKCTIFDLPPPVGPYYPLCRKYWAMSALECLKY
ncbi:MAG: S8 family serine peptidase [Deltaproteobacteria bacterium]|nr:S8 family serine peptidase [Deltaproteobacteria bacterium]